MNPAGVPARGLPRRRCLGLLAAAPAVLAAGCGTRAAIMAGERVVPSEAGGTSGVPAWVLARPALAQAAANATVRTGLSRLRVYELLQPGQQPRQLAGSVPAVAFASAAELAAAVRDGQLPGGTEAVLYDPEAWTFTPPGEQRDPVAAAERAAAAAHDRGLQLIVAPGVNLVTVLAPAGAGPRWRRLLDLGLLARLAARADVIVIQAQSLERDAADYAAFVTAAARQARQASRRVGLLAGLSTNPPGSPVTARQLLAAFLATRSVVDGFWLNIPAPGPQCPTCNPVRPDIGIDTLLAALHDSSGPAVSPSAG